MAATKFSFYVISTSDRGDFPHIIVIALFYFILELSHNNGHKQLTVYNKWGKHNLFLSLKTQLTFHLFNPYVDLKVILNLKYQTR